MVLIKYLSLWGVSKENFLVPSLTKWTNIPLYVSAQTGLFQSEAQINNPSSSSAYQDIVMLYMHKQNIYQFLSMGKLRSSLFIVVWELHPIQVLDM